MQCGRHSSVVLSAPTILRYPGSNPKHTMYAFSICIIEIVREKDKNKQKEAGIGPFLMLIVQWLWLSWQRVTSEIEQRPFSSNPFISKSLLGKCIQLVLTVVAKTEIKRDRDLPIFKAEVINYY